MFAARETRNGCVHWISRCVPGAHAGEIELGDQGVRDRGACGSEGRCYGGNSEILVSSTVKDLVVGSGLAFEDAGEHELKGVPDRWRLYRVMK